jgi:peptide deformylase
MKLDVLTYPSQTLKKKSVPVKDFNSWLTDLAEAMFETMYTERGIGLAAPQVGENINLFVMDVGRPDPQDAEKILSHKICMVNPKITEAEGLLVLPRAFG